MRYLFYTVFVLVTATLLFFVHRFLWQRLVRDTELPPLARRAGTALIVGGGLLVPVAMFLAKRVPREYVELMALAAFAWLGSLLYLIIGLAPWEIARKVRERSQDDTTAPDPARRLFLARAAAGTAMVGSGGIVTVGVSNALGDITTPEVNVTLDRLPKALDGFRIVQLSDVHIGAILDKRFLSSVVEKANALKPDLVVITGDLVDGPVRGIGKDVAALTGLKSRYGSYFVTGNHEYYSGADEWIQFLNHNRIRVLTNEHVAIGEKGHSFDLAGIPDKRAGLFVDAHAPSVAAAVQGRDPDRELILLAHRPNHIDEAAEHGVGLQLSGHTHGGQLWPINALTHLVHPYVDGLHRHNDRTSIYVSRGTGFWGPPMRILAPSEITSIVLSSTS